MRREGVKQYVTDRREPKALAQHLHDAEVRIFNDKRRGAAPRFGEINVCLIYDCNTFEWFVV